MRDLLLVIFLFVAIFYAFKRPYLGVAAWVWIALTAPAAWASIGSPRVVPVPCASTASTSAVDSPPEASACRMTRCWDGPLGAVSPLLSPFQGLF